MTTETRTAVSPEMAEAILGALLRIKEEDGAVSNQDAERAAVLLGVTRRTIRRMIDRGYVHRPRPSWTPSEELTALIVQGKGSIAGVHEHLTRSGKHPGCHKRTMQRWASRLFDQRVLAGARGGYEALRATLPTVDIEIDHINDEWAMDHTLLPNWVVMPDGTVGKPWMSGIMDSASRFILTATFSPDTPSTEDDVETLATAGVGYRTEDGVRIGGQPGALRSDRGGDFISQAMTIGLIRNDINRVFTEAYSPNQNGRIEKWHRTIKDDVCAFLPGYDRTRWTAHDPRRETTPPDPAGLLPYDEFVRRMLEGIRAYNFERPHRALGGKTPYERWAEDTVDIQEMDEQAIRAAMQQEMTRVVRKGRVRWQDRAYHLNSRRIPDAAPIPGGDTDTDSPAANDLRTWSSRLEGKKVIVRFLPTRYEQVEIYTLDGTYVTSATWSRLLDPKQAAEARRERRAAIRTLRTSLEDITAQGEAARKANLDAALAQQPNEDDRVYGPQPKPAKKPPQAKRSRRKGTAAATEEAERTALARSELSESVLARTGTDDWS